MSWVMRILRQDCIRIKPTTKTNYQSWNPNYHEFHRILIQIIKGRIVATGIPCLSSPNWVCNHKDQNNITVAKTQNLWTNRSVIRVRTPYHQPRQDKNLISYIERQFRPIEPLHTTIETMFYFQNSLWKKLTLVSKNKFTCLKFIYAVFSLI